MLVVMDGDPLKKVVKNSGVIITSTIVPRSTISEAGQSILKNVLFFEICSSDRRARYTRTQANSSEKEPSHHFERDKPCGIFF